MKDLICGVGLVTMFAMCIILVVTWLAENLPPVVGVGVVAWFVWSCRWTIIRDRGSNAGQTRDNN